MLGFDEFAPRQSRRAARRCLSGRLSAVRERRGRACRSCSPAARDYLAGQTPEAEGRRARQDQLPRLPHRHLQAARRRRRFLPGTVERQLRLRHRRHRRASMPWARASPAPGPCRIEDQAGGHAEEKAAYVHHFPDGNASLARALVRSLVVGVGARPHHGRPRHHGLRLSGPGPTGCAGAHPPAVDRRQGAQHAGRPRRSTSATSRTASCAACGRAARWSPPTRTVMPYLCPELERDPVELLLSNVKAPLVYTKVRGAQLAELRAARHAQDLGAHELPHHRQARLSRQPRRLQVPAPAHRSDGAAPRARAAGARARATTCARRRASAAAGCWARASPTSSAPSARTSTACWARAGSTAGRDILAITVNRWSHGYSYTPNSLYDDVEQMQAQSRRGARPSSATSCSPTPTRPGTPMPMPPWRRPCAPSASCWAPRPCKCGSRGTSAFSGDSRRS